MARELAVRALRLPEDLPALAAFDTSYTTDRIYELSSDEHSFRLREVYCDPPRTGRHSLADLAAELLRADAGVVAVAGAEAIGFAALRVEAWNRRAILTHLYVDGSRRRHGAGRLLVEAMLDAARKAGARQLWLETQNANYPATQFYQRVGFRLCGLDRDLYDTHEAPGEVALYFSRDLVDR